MITMTKCHFIQELAREYNMNLMSWTYFTFDICISTGISGCFHGYSSVYLLMCDGVAQNSAVCCERWLPWYYNTGWCCLVSRASDLFWHWKSSRFFNNVHEISGIQGRYFHTQFYLGFTNFLSVLVCQWKQYHKTQACRGFHMIMIPRGWNGRVFNGSL